MNHETDILVIGAGVVGCAIARELSIKYPEKKITVLEKLGEAGLETSSKNSGVLHSGIHQNPAFLKSRLAVQGSKLAKNFAKEKKLSVLDSGMLVVVSKKFIFKALRKELRTLWNLTRNARKHGIKLKFLTFFGIKKLEPNIKALGGLFIPEVCVVDSLQFTQALKNDAESMGAKFYFFNPVVKIRQNGNQYEVFTNHSWFTSSVVINSAGLYADDVARMAGFSEYKIYPWRGEYYEILGEKANLVKRLVYPVVPKDSPSKGIHFSPRVNGQLFVGPNAKPVPTKHFYEEEKTDVEEFLNHISKYLPQIERSDLQWAYSGIRPKTTPDTEESDFIINVDNKNPTFVNLIGIESPGLASAMAIAEYVNELLN